MVPRTPQLVSVQPWAGGMAWPPESPFTSQFLFVHYMLEARITLTFSPVTYGCESREGVFTSLSCRFLSAEWAAHRISLPGFREALRR